MLIAFPSFAVFKFPFMEIVIDLNESGAVCVGVQYMEEGNGALIKESRILFLDCGPSGCRPFSYVITPVVRYRDAGTDLVITIYRSRVRQFSIAKNVVSTRKDSSSLAPNEIHPVRRTTGLSREQDWSTSRRSASKEWVAAFLDETRGLTRRYIDTDANWHGVQRLALSASSLSGKTVESLSSADFGRRCE